MYCRVLRLRDGRRLLTYTQRAVSWPIGLRAMLSYDDGETWDFENDQIILEGFTPWGAESGGAFGNTLELADGTLVSCYSYRASDSRTYIEVVRWRIPWSRDERVIYYDARLFDASRKEGLVPLYDWATGKGARVVPRDLPYVETMKEEHAVILKGPIEADGEAFSAEIRMKSRDESGVSWRGLTLRDLAIRDWSPYAGVVIRMHNAGGEPQEVYLGVRHESGSHAAVQKATLAPGETQDLFATIDELKTDIDVCNVRTVCIACVAPGGMRGLLVGPLYLVKREK